ncbi:arsenical pump membrane protein [Rhodoblastus acidophilus]|uniref:arsenic transporter n=1 Tax=Rhodoblastus acidophilus TaxID=1074 RepID=UPI00222525BA|nr:arsenic transporter [Rhodoblastus acidophilus]MCW2282368.1 arsenical pump membrane protein [Rhodoblastus acidophilus]MCW2331227.1 arsenical pump membrane protein [Rhodoblastus acidophilus]
MNWQILGITGLATAGVILRPFHWPEAIWAVAGAALLVLTHLLPAGAAWAGVARGADVYMFLTGMMLLSEAARREGLFDFLAAEAAKHARGSANRLFLLVYLVGVLVTVFLSNDATAVVLTPAVFAATQAAKVEKPLPYLYLCAFVANAASFVLPISNPANLVVYGRAGLPPLLDWLKIFGLPSLAAIVVTYAALRLMLRRELAAPIAEPQESPHLSAGGKVAAFGLAATALVLLVASARGLDLGAPTLFAGAGTTILVLLVRRSNPWPLVRDIHWGVLPLVAGLFVFVEALDQIGVTAQLAGLLRQAPPVWGAAASGAAVAFGSNLVNNLPAGLIAASAVHQAAAPPDVTAAILIGVDLGPNLSVTGSLATILWLAVLRREQQRVRDRDFLLLGVVVMPLALIAALALV